MTVTTASFDLAGRVALVTGAAGGLGQCFARTLHGAGATLILCGRDSDRPELVSLAEELGGDTQRMSLDVCSQESIENAFAKLDEQRAVVNVLVNNAGIAISGPAHTLDSDAWDAVLGTNLNGAWTLAQAFASRLIEKQQAGSIINIASILGLQPSKVTAPYSISKAGMIQMTRALALEWARFNIRVNAISPGYVETDINRGYLNTDAGRDQIKRIPTRRVGLAEDLAGPLLLLASDAGRHMTGANLVVDGGHSCMGL